MVCCCDDVLWVYRYLHWTVAGSSCAMVLMDKTKGWSEKAENDERESVIGAKLAASFGIFSKAVKNKWSPADGDDRRRRLIRDMNEMCVRVEEDHVWVSDFNMVLQEQEILENLQ